MKIISNNSWSLWYERAEYRNILNLKAKRYSSPLPIIYGILNYKNIFDWFWRGDKICKLHFTSLSHFTLFHLWPRSEEHWTLRRAQPVLSLCVDICRYPILDIWYRRLWCCSIHHWVSASLLGLVPPPLVPLPPPVDQLAELLQAGVQPLPRHRAGLLHRPQPAVQVTQPWAEQSRDSQTRCQHEFFHWTLNSSQFMKLDFVEHHQVKSPVCQ